MLKVLSTLLLQQQQQQHHQDVTSRAASALRTAAARTLYVLAAAVLAVFLVDLLLIADLEVPSHPYIKPIFDARVALWQSNALALPQWLHVPLQTIISCVTTVGMGILAWHRIWLPWQSNAPLPKVAMPLAYLCVAAHTVLYASHIFLTVIVMYQPLMALHHVLTLAMLWSGLQETHLLCFWMIAPYWLHEQAWVLRESVLTNTPTSLHMFFLVFYNVAVYFAACTAYYLGVKGVVHKRLGVLIFAILAVNYGFYCTNLRGAWCPIPVQGDMSVFVVLVDAQSKNYVMVEAAFSAIAAAGLGFVCLCSVIECLAITSVQWSSCGPLRMLLRPKRSLEERMLLRMLLRSLRSLEERI